MHWMYLVAKKPTNFLYFMFVTLLLFFLISICIRKPFLNRSMFDLLISLFFSFDSNKKKLEWNRITLNHCHSLNGEKSQIEWIWNESKVFRLFQFGICHSGNTFQLTKYWKYFLFTFLNEIKHLAHLSSNE